MTRLLIFLLLLFFFLFPKTINAASYYVSTTGSDSNPGTQTQPWRTISKVNSSGSILRSGDSILFKRGETWAELMVIPISGLNIGVYGTGVKPIITGSNTRNHCIQSSGKSNIVVDGIHCTATVWEGVYLGLGSGLRVLNYDATDLEVGVQIDQSSNFEIANCVVRNTNRDGISVVRSTNGTVHDNNVSHSGMVVDDRSGISIWNNSSGVRVYNNVSYDHSNPGPVGIRGIIIDQNYGSGVNYVYQNTTYNSDGGGIEIYQSNNAQVYNNLSYGNGGPNDWRDGIYLHDSTGGLVYNNTSYNNKNAAIRTRDATGFVITNNIGYQLSNVVFSTEAIGATTQQVDHNLWYGTPILYSWNVISYYSPTAFFQATGQGQHDISTNPLFTSDYHLQPNSPACSAGTGGTYIGAFPCVSTNTLTPTRTPTPTSTPTPTPSLPGDANGDGRVDGLDYMIWLNHYNQVVSGPINGDFNNSGNVDRSDYVIWLNNYST